MVGNRKNCTSKSQCVEFKSPQTLQNISKQIKSSNIGIYMVDAEIEKCIPNFLKTVKIKSNH